MYEILDIIFKKALTLIERPEMLVKTQWGISRLLAVPVHLIPAISLVGRVEHTNTPNAARFSTSDFSKSCAIVVWTF